MKSMSTATRDQFSRAEQAYRHVLEFIESGQIAAGDRLPSEAELEAQLGLSRASVREALARLRAEGRVQSRRGSGSFLTEGRPAELVRLSTITSVPELIEWHEFRLALESEVASLAAERATDEDVARMRAAQELLMERLSAGAASREDAAFHRAIATASRNRKLEDAIAALANHVIEWARMGQVKRVMSPAERREIIASEHGEIVDAIAAHNAERARSAVRRHLLNGRARLLSAIGP
ncbi:MAG: FadR family transcriptional regulator [Alphaproteobacteria bacterium]|nr:FadR family transcriptional regulator [Alphaproteobacteria bacterium]